MIKISDAQRESTLSWKKRDENSKFICFLCIFHEILVSAEIFRAISHSNASLIKIQKLSQWGSKTNFLATIILFLILIKNLQ